VNDNFSKETNNESGGGIRKLSSHHINNNNCTSVRSKSASGTIVNSSLCLLPPVVRASLPLTQTSNIANHSISRMVEHVLPPLRYHSAPTAVSRSFNLPPVVLTSKTPKPNFTKLETFSFDEEENSNL
jgi:hypothetical protein